MKNPKVSPTLANIYAEAAIKTLRENDRKRLAEERERARNSSESRHLRLLHRKSQSADKAFEAFKRKFEKKFNVDIMTYGQQFNLREGHQKQFSQKDVKNAIIVASHAEGISQDKLIAYAVKKFS